MQREIAIMALVFTAVLLSGCTQLFSPNTPEQVANENTEVNLFKGQYPNAAVSEDLFKESDFPKIAEEIRDDCLNPYIGTKEYYRLNLKDADSGDSVTVWVDVKGNKVECVYRELAPEEKPAEKCVAGWACKDSMHKAYRNEECKWEGEKFCEFGCEAGECLAGDGQGEQDPADLCAGILCPDVCESGARKYDGGCVNGVCQYSVTACDFGCGDGACKGDPCTDVTCQNVCEGSIRKYNSTCLNGVCNYGSSENCQYGCINGMCNANPCAGVDCPNTCDGSTRKYNGQCEGGACTYTTEECTNGCENGACNAPPKPVGTIFITNATWTGNDIGGAAGANEKCASAAAAVNFAGTWKAMIGTPTQNMAPMIPDAVYRRVDGAIIAESKVELFGVTRQSNIELSELGVKYTASGNVWTGVNSSGFTNSNTCGDWDTAAGAGQIGNASHTNMGWIWLETKACTEYAGLYCIKTA